LIDFLNQVYELSQFLSLNRKDINKELNPRGSILTGLFSIVLVFLVIIIVISAVLMGMNNTNVQDNTYATGTFYSTTKLKDIKNKNEVKYWLWKKLRSRLL
jgi:hypothetical protein